MSLTFRAKAGLLVLAAVAILSNLRLLVELFGDYTSPSRETYGIAGFEGHYEPLRQVLPKRGVVGYITEPSRDPADPITVAEFYVTQYALAPVIVVNSPNQDYVIGNFRTAPQPSYYFDRNLTLLKDFGNGVALFRGSAK